MTDTLEILNSRLFPVGRAALFDAFADPAKLAAWWGPEGFCNRITAFDFRPGGGWRVTMTADNGTAYHNRWTIEDVIAGELIRMTHHEPVHVFRLEMRFADADGGARLAWQMQFDRSEEIVQIEKFLHAANEQNFDRLERFLK
ncbi:SRPBCC domain-containing protein [Hoeflea ulvae]|uniref:SRPBCC domain-containing protein n=1 Tax=Hoeflea ulvae TaxID=2983764 RepID=A0ABT3YK53_9HYPH|nr:SRPBCC domain-containing protein [Hoeflea ulvae]MCY0096120.1 SRPBCC domain-containing protein [Hoeflea ulvae]